MSRFTVTEEGKVYDKKPSDGSFLAEFVDGSWRKDTGTFGDLMDSKPITDAEALRLTSSEIASK